MGLTTVHVDMIKRHCERKGTAACFGYPDRKGPDAEDITAYEFFLKEFNMQLTVFDIVTDRGEVYFDLNFPQPDSEAFDLVINPGTFEHVFNPGIALETMYKMTKQNGLMLYHGPYKRPNHGLWEAHPKLFYKFFKVCGADILEFNYIKGNKNKKIITNELDRAGSYAVLARKKFNRFTRAYDA